MTLEEQVKKYRKKAKRFKRKYLELKRKIDHDGCLDCRFVELDVHQYPCNVCKQNYTDLYERKENTL